MISSSAFVVLILLVSCASPSKALLDSSQIKTPDYNGRINHLNALNEKCAQAKIETYKEKSIDWNLYNLKQQYQKSGGILYKQSLLSPNEYSAIMKELAVLDLHIEDENQSSFASKRVGCTISKDSDIYRILKNENGSLSKLVNALEGECEERLILAPEVPVELRVYEKTGAGMEWHIDDLLYNPAQVEVVLTLENNSDCCTMWKPLNGGIQSVQTTPNSGLILKSGGVEHKVSPLKIGRRVILKVAFVAKCAVILDDMVGHASHHNGKNKIKKRKR